MSHREAHGRRTGAGVPGETGGLQEVQTYRGGEAKAHTSTAKRSAVPLK